MSYESITLKRELLIDKIIYIHYFEYLSDVSFSGESHDFWEFLCVDKGMVNVAAGTDTFSLRKDQIIFHKPKEFHNICADGIVAPRLVMIGFECHSPAMKFFENKVLSISPAQRSLLGNIIREASLTYSSHLDDSCCEKLIRKDKKSVPFASEQLIQTYLQQFLIGLIRNYNDINSDDPFPKSFRQKSEDELFSQIIAYMEEHMDTQLTIQQICLDNLVGRSILQRLFRDQAGCGIIDYFAIMKVNAAKQYIRTHQMNFSQIADKLGYNSIHYFSRQFKKITGMTPSEYAASVKSIAEPPVK